MQYLTQDKEYLKVQVRSLEERLTTADARLAKEEGEMLELKAELSRAKEAQVVSSKEHAEEYAAKLQIEMQRWQMTHKAAQDAAMDAHLAAVNNHKCVAPPRAVLYKRNRPIHVALASHSTAFDPPPASPLRAATQGL